MNLFLKNKFCFLLGLVTKTNPRLTEDKRALPSFPLFSVKGKRLIHAWWNITYLPTRSPICEPPPITMRFVNHSQGTWTMIRVISYHYWEIYKTYIIYYIVELFIGLYYYISDSILDIVYYITYYIRYSREDWKHRNIET